METNPHQTLEEVIQRELSKLPERQAPETLIPRVLAQIQARVHKRWWQRPWTQWPGPVQLASLPLMLASAGGAVFAITLLWDFIVSTSDFNAVSNQLGIVSAFWDVFLALVNAVFILSRAATQEWLLLLVFVPLAMYLACVGLGTLCYRTAFHRRQAAP